ncbi:hypothetical protein [Streptomyces canus]|uniref:hypothetical protein n=1 Tax=Streptomyces canus TaxID=58343 RepID=UPI0037FAD92B
MAALLSLWCVPVMRVTQASPPPMVLMQSDAWSASEVRTLGGDDPVFEHGVQDVHIVIGYWIA